MIAGAALDEVRKAESEAERLVADAKKKAAAIVLDARGKASQFLKDREHELAVRKAQLEAKRSERMLAIREKAMAGGSLELKSLRKSAERKVDDAVGIVLDGFEREISEC